jgi:NADH dehydrogenase (ubiquinone) Fe-S protein 6
MASTSLRKVEPARRERYLWAMIPPPEIIKVKSVRVACDGSGEVPAALGHPRVYLHIDDQLGFVDCGYCDRRFVLEGGPSDSTVTGA